MPCNLSPSMGDQFLFTIFCHTLDILKHAEIPTKRPPLLAAVLLLMHRVATECRRQLTSCME